MTELIETSAIFGNIKITYQYKKSKPSKTLNSMGNFYRSSHLHKKTQKFMEEYIKEGNVPKIGEKIYSDKLFSDLTIINVTHDYQRTEGENWIKKVEDELKKRKEERKSK